MIFEDIKSNIKISDEDFNLIYDEHLREMAEIHFSPFDVSKQSAQYLVTHIGTKVLDIGSGAGKFCMIGSLVSDGFFYGIEQRQLFIDISNKISIENKLNNLTFILGNITDIDFEKYDAFYIFNPFYENISRTGFIDDDIELKKELYEIYSLYVNFQLDQKPKGTRLVTYFSYSKEIPKSYVLLFSNFDDKLKFWEKGS